VLKLVCPNPTCAAAVRHAIHPVGCGRLTRLVRLGCEHQVDEEDLKNILTNKQFVRYQQFFLLASLRNDPTVRWCPKYVDAHPCSLSHSLTHLDRPGCETAAHGSEEDCHMMCASCCTHLLLNPTCCISSQPGRANVSYTLLVTTATEFCWKCNLEWHPGMDCERSKRQAQKGKKKLTLADRKVQLTARLILRLIDCRPLLTTDPR
jgi:hypothetical protein